MIITLYVIKKCYTRTLQDSWRAKEIGLPLCKAEGRICPPNRFQNVNVAAEIAITPYVKRPATCNCQKKQKQILVLK